MSDWDRVAALFDALAALPPAERDAELARQTQADPALAREVRSLLEAQDRAGSFLQSPIWADRPDLLRDDAALTGRRLGPYQVHDVVGRGGMGVVYAAEDTRLGRKVALKALPPHVSGDPLARERLAREARAAARLTHPGIATVYALEEIDGHVVIASELVRGRTLRDELAAGPLSAEALTDTLIQIAEALDAAHRQGIVHRDLKPENVLRDENGRIKIVDFGLARALSAAPGLTAAGISVGTPGYMAPEQLRGQPVDARADVFAFGVMTFELASGRHPFGLGDQASLLERVVAGAPPLRLDLHPASLTPIVRRCLRANPLERYQSAGDIVSALRFGGSAERRAWWWQFHQVAVAVLTIVAVTIIGFKHGWLGAW